MKKTIKFMIYSKKGTNKTTGKSFTKRFTFYDFLNEDGTRTRKGIDVKFTEKAFNNCELSEKNITRGIIEVKADALGCPDKYVVTKNEEGKDVYPCAWVRDNGVVSFEEKRKEHEFHFSAVEDNEEETEEVEVEE